MVSLNEIRVGSILAIIDDEKTTASFVVAVDEFGLVHLDGMDGPESIENMVGVKIDREFLCHNRTRLDKAKEAGLQISESQIDLDAGVTVQLEFNGAFIKSCDYAHQLQNILFDLLGIELDKASNS